MKWSNFMKKKKKQKKKKIMKKTIFFIGFGTKNDWVPVRYAAVFILKCIILPALHISVYR